MSDEFDSGAIIQAVRLACQQAATCPIESAIEVINIEARKQRDMVAELRQTCAHLVQVQEEERSRVAIELHDNVAQLLSAAKMALASDQTVLHAILDESIQAVRRLGAELRPSLLDHVGLGAALQSLVRTTQEETGLQCTVRVDSPPRISADKRIALYRICQEAITNVRRHSQATKLGVELYENGGELHLVVTDNGKGFDPGAIPKRAFGLLGIRERLRFFGGSLEINCVDPHGTRLAIRLPMIESEGERG